MIESVFVQILIIFGFTIAVAYVSALLRFPLIIAFILSGIAIGPYGLKIVSHNELINSMAEIGLAMLLFTIGLEFNRGRIRNLQRYFLIGGSMQVFLTSLLIFVVMIVFENSLAVALIFAFILTLSSSALGFRLLNDKKITRSLQGNLISGILLFQDIAFVPMLISIPFLALKKSKFDFKPADFIIYAIIFLFFLILIKKFGEKVFRYLVSFHYRELNLMLAIFIPLTCSILTNKMGFSFSLGAFIAGSLLAESDFHLQIISDIVPFKDIFNAFFFIAAGMLFELKSFFDNFERVIVVVLLLLLIKGSIIILVGLLIRFRFNYALLAALYLFPLSEFSIVLANVAHNGGLISKGDYDLLFSVAIFSILIAPVLIEIFEKLQFKSLISEPSKSDDQVLKLKKHTVIAGYGVTGKNLRFALQKVRLPFVVVDLNFQNYKLLKKEGVLAVFGDISSEEVMQAVNIKEATVFVIAVSDPNAMRIAISKARQKNPVLQIIVRTRYLSEMDRLYQLGASEVVGEEFESSIEIFSRTLRHYHIPGNVVENIIKVIRNQNYAILRGRSSIDLRWEKLNALIEAGTVETFLIDQQMFAAGKSLEKINLRKRTDATIVAIIRQGKSYPSPRADFVLQSDDIVVITAAHQNLEKAFFYLEKGEYKDLK